MKDTRIFKTQDYVLYVDRDSIIEEIYEGDIKVKVSDNIPTDLFTDCDEPEPRYFELTKSSCGNYNIDNCVGSNTDDNNNPYYYANNFDIYPQDMVFNGITYSKGIWYFPPTNGDEISNEWEYTIGIFYTKQKVSNDIIVEKETHPIEEKYIPGGGGGNNTRIWYIEQTENGCTEYMDNWSENGGNTIPTSEIQEVCDKALNGEIPNVIIYMKCSDDQYLAYRSDSGSSAVYYSLATSSYVLRYAGTVSDDGDNLYIQFKGSAINSFSDSQGEGFGEFVIYAVIQEDGTYEPCNSTAKVLNVYSYSYSQNQQS